MVAQKAMHRNGSMEALSGDVASKGIMIEPIDIRVARFDIVGVTPLIVHNWSVKSRNEMLDKQKGAVKKKRPPKNPEEDYLGSLYVSTEGWTGIPAVGFKAALVNSCRLIDGLPMTLCKRLFFIRPEGVTKDGTGIIRIHGEHQMHESMVRLDSGTADIRFRAIYPEWSAFVEIEYQAKAISVDQIANLIELAGYCEGLCEWRPGSPKSQTGSCGRFTIKKLDA